MKKKFLSMILAICMVVGLLPAMTLGASAAEVASGTSGDVSWTLTDDGTLTFSGEGAIGNDQSWIEHMDLITSIVIEDGITTIGNYAFYECAGFESVTLPASLTTIGNYAFTDCSDLKSVTIPASVTKIGNSVFYQCTSLATVNYLGASEPTVGSYVFVGCSSTTANVPVDYEGDTFAGLSVSKTLCDHAGHTQTGCTACGATDESIHSFVSGTCSVCGLSSASTAPAAPNVDNVNNAIYVFVCNTQLPAGQFHQATGITFDSNYSEAGEPVKNADGKWIAEVTCKVKAMWENHTSYIYEYNYPDHAHTPHDELPETLTVTLTWDSEAEEWVCDNDDVTYDISCAAADVAEVDGQGFGTLAEAVAHAQTVEGSTLKLLQNLSLDTAITIDSGKFTIDLNGFVWERSGYVLYVQGTADVKLTSSAPGGVIRGTAAGCPTVLVMNASYMEINGGTVEHTAQGLAIDTSAGGNPTEARLLISGGKVTTNGYLAIKAFGSAVTVTGGILESALYEIQYYTGTIDLSGHTNPTGIGIKIGYNVTEVAVGTDILLPAGYCLMDDSTGEPATTLVDGGQYTVAAESATPEPATVTGVSFSGNGVTFDAETNTYYVSSDATDITVTITGTNFANLTEEYFVNFAYNGIIVILECYVDVENNIASFTRADASEFFGSDGHELYYFTDGGATWTNLGVYVTYVDSTELTYSVVGSFNGWETSDTAYDMTLGADGKYTLTKELPAGTYDFKIVKNHAWEVNYGCGTSVENGVTYNLELGGFDASFTLDADAEVTFIFDLAAQTITVSWEETSSTPEPATVTGVSFSGNGVTFDAETNTYYISVDATDITMTVTGTNFAQLTENYYVQFAARTRVAIDELFMDVDVENNLATRADLPVGGFEGSDGNEIRYTTDGGETWTGLGIYVTYVEDTSPDYATKAELEAAIAELQQLINQLEQTYGIEVPALQDALTALQQQVAALDDTYATDEDVKALGDELNALIQRVTDLENTYATKTELEAAIAELQQQINALAAYGADITQLKSDLTALQQQVAALDGTYATDEDVKALSDELNSLIQRVTALENTYATKAELEAEIARLEQLIADLELAYGADNAGLAAELATLQQQLTDLQTALNALDDTYVNETQLIDAVNTINQSITDLASRVAALEATYATKAELEEAIKILNEAIAAGDATAAEALAEAVSKLEKALADAVAALETADAENKAALEAMIAEAKAALEEAIAQLRSDLEDAVEDLENADKENAEALAKAIEDLTAVIKAVEAASAAEDAKIREELNRAKASLYASIAKLTTDLETAKTELTAAIANGDAALDQKIAELSAALNAAIAASNAADEALKTELSAAIADGDAALQAAIDAVAQNLTKAEEELNAAIAAGDKDLDDKIAALNAALEAAIAASDAADGALNTRIDEAVAALNAAIAQVQKNLDEAKAELTEKDAQLEAKDAQLNKLSVAALVIACVGVAGCLALLVYIIIDKRKKK